jgi:hypothetical protein
MAAALAGAGAIIGQSGGQGSQAAAVATAGPPATTSMIVATKANRADQLRKPSPNAAENGPAPLQAQGRPFLTGERGVLGEAVRRAGIEEQNRRPLERQRAFRLAADIVTDAWMAFPEVWAIAVIGSVAKPLWKEAPRFRASRRAPTCRPPTRRRIDGTPAGCARPSICPRSTRGSSMSEYQYYEFQAIDRPLIAPPGGVAVGFVSGADHRDEFHQSLRMGRPQGRSAQARGMGV